jgi:hypothetical protein
MGHTMVEMLALLVLRLNILLLGLHQSHKLVQLLPIHQLHFSVLSIVDCSNLDVYPRAVSGATIRSCCRRALGDATRRSGLPLFSSSDRSLSSSPSDILLSLSPGDMGLWPSRTLSGARRHRVGLEGCHSSRWYERPDPRSCRAGRSSNYQRRRYTLVGCSSARSRPRARSLRTGPSWRMATILLTTIRRFPSYDCGQEHTKYSNRGGDRRDAGGSARPEIAGRWFNASVSGAAVSVRQR